ncbi:MAG: hypothetical protein NZ845_03300 [Thermodesulfovibrio sp.]|nr:hypothetical protein [Thermodesulfovibrio sp.]
MKKILLILIALITFLALTVYSKSSTVSKENEDLVEIAHKEIFGTLNYGKVIFKHQRHIDAISKILNKPKDLTCKECHLRDENGEFVFYFQTTTNLKDPEQLKNLYHKECLKCHQMLTAQNKKAGPEILSCRDCHKRKNEKLEVKYPMFVFDFSLHDRHVSKNKKDCSICHHIYDIEEKNKEIALVYEKGTEQSCYYCHDFTKKRGPELSKIVNVAKQKNLDIKTSFHKLCINCHLQNRIQSIESGPIECLKCHTGKYKTVEELKDIPRPDIGQPDRVFLSIEGGKMKGVPFKHEFHEKNNKSCRECHHETLRACRDCHTLKGKQEGGFVNTLTAFHSTNSSISCQGCHRNMTLRKECFGCHYLIPPIKTEIGRRDICTRCHKGKKEFEEMKPFKVSLDNIKNEVLINHIENEFEPVKMPHYKIVKKLVDISNQSRIATYFHRDIQSICKGCHHKTKEDAEANREKPPLCASCHSVYFDSKALGRPRLEAAYHGMCIKCHENMSLEKPRKCYDCHKRKRGNINVYN